MTTHITELENIDRNREHTLDGEQVSLIEFLEDNKESVTLSEVDDILNLKPNEEYHFFPRVLRRTK